MDGGVITVTNDGHPAGWTIQMIVEQTYPGEYMAFRPEMPGVIALGGTVDEAADKLQALHANIKARTMNAILYPDTLTDGTPGFLAQDLVNPGCYGFGATPDEALAQLEVSREAFRRSGL